MLFKSEYSDIWILLSRHKWVKSWANIQDSIVSFLNEIFTDHHLLLSFRKTVWGSSIGTSNGKISSELKNVWIFIVNKQGSFLSVYVDDVKVLGKETEHDSLGEEIEKCGSRRINIISWPRVFDMHSTWVHVERNHDCQIQKNVEITGLQKKNEKLSGCKRPHVNTVSWSEDMKGHAKKSVGRYCELSNIKTSIVQSLNSLLTWSSLQEGGAGFEWRIVNSLLTDCLEIPVLVTNWMSWQSVVSEPTYYQIDRLFPTFSSVEFIHSSHKRSQTILSCG